MPRLLVIRHGQTDLNSQHVLQGPRIDTDLSEVGRRQAAALADALRSMDLRRVLSSPLRRARQTAQAIVDAHPEHPAVEVMPELYEMDYGQFGGRRVEEVRDAMEQTLDAWRMGFVDEAFPGGESALLAQHRIRPAALRLRGMMADEDVCVVAHGRINRILLATLLGRGLQTQDDFPQDNANITELQWDGQRVQLVRVNDTSHLDQRTSSFS